MPKRDRRALCLLSAVFIGADVVDETELAVIETGVAGAELLDCWMGPPGKFAAEAGTMPVVGCGAAVEAIKLLKRDSTLAGGEC